jgi:excinuclease ABC subunit C
LPSNTTSLNDRQSLNSELLSCIQKLPDQPGVYRMLNEHGRIIYVGKAINLKKRVSQYFQKNQTHPKTQALVQHIHSIDVTLTHNETEALLLESHLIKTHQPKYNILLRDDKSYPYLVIDTTHPFPSLTIHRSKHQPKHGLSFGPFPNAHAIHETLQFLQKCFKIRSCRDAQFANRSRPCMQYEIKRCGAPCTAYITQEAYQQSLQQCIQFLTGESKKLQEQLMQRMDEAIQNLAFEEAARLRDLLQQLRRLQQTQAIVHHTEDSDVIVIQAFPPYALEHVEIRQGHILNHQAYFPKLSDALFENDAFSPSEIWQTIFDAFFREHYFEQPQRIPFQIITQDIMQDEQRQTYDRLFKSMAKHECRIITHARGVQQNWLEFAMKNLHLHLEQKIQPTVRFQQRWQALNHELQAPDDLKRIHCFDVSHHQGQATVASCVSFTELGKETKHYRIYGIRKARAGDDYQALKEALDRHLDALKDNADDLPSLILIDGGKGQVHAAEEVLKKHSMTHIPLLGLCKGERRRACFDRVFSAQTQSFLNWDSTHPGLHVLQAIRDEAHRFAIQTSRKKRNQSLISSSLEAIDGIGPVKRQRLLQHFGGLQDLKKATYEELLQVPGMSPILAERVLKHLK